MKPALFAFVSIVFLAVAAGAQVTVEVGPLLGYYRPTGTFDPGIRSTALPNAPSDLSGVALGAEASVQFGPRFAARLQAAEAASTIYAGPTPDGIEHRPTSARVSMATAEAVVDVVAAPQGVVWVSAGPALVRHGGDAYAPYGSPTQFAVALGVGSTVIVARRLRATLGLSALRYELNIPLPRNLSLNPGSMERGTMTDLLLRAAVTWSVQ
jgi:hypothetical protein